MIKLLLVVGLLLLPINSNAVVKVTFDHSQDKSNIQSIDVSEGSYFEVDIINTCAEIFEARYYGLEKKAEQPQPSSAPGPEAAPRDGNLSKINPFKMNEYLDGIKGCEVQKPISIKIPHDPKYGGYRIDIDGRDKTNKQKFPITSITYNVGQSKDSINSELDNIYENEIKVKPAGESNGIFLNRVKELQKTFIEKNIGRKELSPTFFVVKVNESPWHVDFAGGFTASYLTDQKYGVSSSNTVFRNKSAEDQANLGFTGFIHTYNDKLNLWDVTLVPLSLGLGINTDSKVSFFVGPSLKFGKAFLTVGWNWGPVKTLPAGVSEGSTISDPNTLSNLPTRTGGNVFIGLSYTFLGTGQEMFQKPFASPAK
jgi:hypothetical protein